AAKKRLRGRGPDRAQTSRGSEHPVPVREPPVGPAVAERGALEGQKTRLILALGSRFKLPEPPGQLGREYPRLLADIFYATRRCMRRQVSVGDQLEGQTPRPQARTLAHQCT